MSVVVDDSERRLSVAAHASALVGLILPLGQILGPYLTQLLLPAGATRARAEAAGAMNFQINVRPLDPRPRQASPQGGAR